jgi:uncharacterized protein
MNLNKAKDKMAHAATILSRDASRSEEKRAVADVIFLAKKNHSEALYAIGTWHKHGSYGFKKSDKLANQYWRNAALSLHPQALYSLAISYEKGEGIKLSEDRAFKNYVLASLAGHLDAVFEAARCFRYGIGCKKNTSLSKELVNFFKTSGGNFLEKMNEKR